MCTLIVHVHSKISRPSFGRVGNLMSAEERKEREVYSKRIKEKKQQYPELFAPKRVLGPLKTKYPPEKSSCGQTILHDRIVSTAVIVTDPLIAKYDIMTSEESSGSTKKESSESETMKSAQMNLDKKISERLSLTEKRNKNVDSFFKNFPLAYEEWPSVLAGSCPVSFMSQGAFSHKASERGVAMAHFQIWQDWYYRNEEAELATMTEAELKLHDTGTGRKFNNDPRCKTPLPPAYKDITISFSSSSNTNSVYKNAKKQHSNDLLVVFEDDVVSDIPMDSLGPAMIRELDNMQANKIDLLFLGWCYGKGLRAMPMCAHAYVITRHMARILMENWEPCGTSLDSQWHALDRRRIIRWAKVHPESYNGTAEVNLQDVVDGKAKDINNVINSNNEDYFRGMFKQGNGMGSFNAHSWMPNAA